MQYRFAKKYRDVAFDPVEIENHYKKLTIETFEKIGRDFLPSFMCLQEITRSEHQFLIDFLEKMGFTVLQKYGTAVCFQNSQFICLDHQMTLNDDTGALYADLRLKGTKKIIRVVSSHLPGFNVSKMTQSPHAVKVGDSALEAQLTTVDTAKRVFSTFFSCFSEVNTPNFIFYGLDANTTADFVSEKVHPERLTPLFMHGFVPDIHDIKATIIDDSTGHPYRYDYLFCKCVNGSATVQNCEIEGINNQAMLGDPDKAMSDHLPVLARLYLL